MKNFCEDVESLIGQFCFAFGAGAGRVRVHRETIRQLQARYRPYLSANMETAEGRDSWSTAKYHLLDYVTAMGRYAACLALEGGDMTILPEHFELAAHRFEAAAHRTRSRALNAGRWCPGGQSTDGPSVPQPQPEFGGRFGSGLSPQPQRLPKEARERLGDVVTEFPDIGER